jgi:hypothetical protein
MKNNIWRSRAITIFGFFIIFINLFHGLPSQLLTVANIILGLLVMVLGFNGSKNPASEIQAKIKTLREVKPEPDNQV